jgi:DNA-binding MarR family transcriptional regulator
MAQCHAILEIEMQGTLSLGELALQLGLDKSTLSRTVDGLVNIGLVERTTSPDDRRSVRLSLTAQGRRTCDLINANNDAAYMRVLSRIAPQQQQAVLESFHTLVDAMAAEMKNGINGCATAE